ncbi:MAG: hypothetical protein COV76_07005 [Candidatus Omnitrophica bacterium CG11_big_fil_rev_8_21_14_0_20_64_10]|nr:MAG: hypothetical protein COV76_07005 [Candidatus Omnitrophica bacterium CG11_big_fil_rev_8_21_14_0_20_64_10]
MPAPTVNRSRVVLTPRAADGQGRPIPAARGFGTSMVPFIRPNEDVWFEPVDPARIRTGDLLLFHPRRRSGSVIDADSTRLVTHRVVRSLRIGDQRAFLTKGDNRLVFDPLVLPQDIVGWVTQAGERRLDRPLWRWLGRLIGRLSYLQGVAYARLRCLPHIRFSILQRALHQGRPLWARRLAQAYPGVVRFLCRGPLSVFWEGMLRLRDGVRLLRAGIRLDRWRPGDAAALTALWNEVSPRRPATVEAFEQRVLGSPVFDYTRCRVLRKGKALLGFGFLARKPEGFRADELQRIECLLFSEKGWQSGGAGPLFRELLRLVAPGPMVQLRYGAPVRGEEDGIIPGRLAELAADHGFEPGAVMTEMVLTREEVDPKRFSRSGDGIQVRPWRTDDSRWFAEQFIGSDFDPELAAAYAAVSEVSIRVAVGEGLPLGLCIAAPASVVLPYSGVPGWIQACVESTVGRGVIVQLSMDLRGDPVGVRAALLESALSELFEKGCREVVVWTPSEKWLQPFGFRPDRRMLVMVLRKEEST